MAAAALKQQFDLAMQAYDAMQIAHRAFLQLTRVRGQHPAAAGVAGA